MALPHHDASHSNQWCSSKAPFFGTKQASNGDVASSADLAISLDDDTSTQIVEDQSLVSLQRDRVPMGDRHT